MINAHLVKTLKEFSTNLQTRRWIPSPLRTTCPPNPSPSALSQPAALQLL